MVSKKEKFKLLDKIVNENPKLKKEMEALQKEARISLKEFYMEEYEKAK
jgi:hypothetical protein